MRAIPQDRRASDFLAALNSRVTRQAARFQIKTSRSHSGKPRDSNERAQCGRSESGRLHQVTTQRYPNVCQKKKPKKQNKQKVVHSNDSSEDEKKDAASLCKRGRNGRQDKRIEFLEMAPIGY